MVQSDPNHTATEEDSLMSSRNQDPKYHRALRRLPALKMKVTTGTNFAAIYNYFFDHFGENPEFMRLGEPSEQPLLEQILTHMANTVYKTQVSLVHSRFVHLPDQKFIHGSCLLKEGVVTFFYFEDLDAGMAALASPGRSVETRLVRFSVKQMGKVTPASGN
jgi:hypothetical protein